jgi:hypothetical protein
MATAPAFPDHRTRHPYLGFIRQLPTLPLRPDSGARPTHTQHPTKQFECHNLEGPITLNP